MKAQDTYLIYTHAMWDFHDWKLHRLFFTLINLKCHDEMTSKTRFQWLSHKNLKIVRLDTDWEKKIRRKKSEQQKHHSFSLKGHRSFGCIYIFNQRVTAWEKVTQEQKQMDPLFSTLKKERKCILKERMNEWIEG